MTKVVKIILEQWKTFENDMQDFRNAAATKLQIDKANEIERNVADFLLDVSSIPGVSEPTPPEQPKLPILETRASLMMLLISLVFSMNHPTNNSESVSV